MATINAQKIISLRSYDGSIVRDCATSNGKNFYYSISLTIGLDKTYSYLLTADIFFHIPSSLRKFLIYLQNCVVPYKKIVLYRHSFSPFNLHIVIYYTLSPLSLTLPIFVQLTCSTPDTSLILPLSTTVFILNCKYTS